MLKKVVLIFIILIFKNNIILTSYTEEEQSNIPDTQDFFQNFFIESVTICSDIPKSNTRTQIFDLNAIVPINKYISQAMHSNRTVSFNGLLEYFIYHEYTNMALKLISFKNININENIMSDGNTPLVFCILNNLNESLQMLLSLPSCNINSQSGEQLITPLMAALSKNNNDLIDYLLSKQNINVNETDSTLNSAIFYAIQLYQIESIHKLIEKNAALNRFNIKNESPLILAIKRQLVDVIEILINTGNCNIELQNSAHKDAKHIALELSIRYPKCRFQEIYQLLTKESTPMAIIDLNYQQTVESEHHEQEKRCSLLCCFGACIIGCIKCCSKISC